MAGGGEPKKYTLCGGFQLAYLSVPYALRSYTMGILQLSGGSYIGDTIPCNLLDAKCSPIGSLLYVRAIVVLFHSYGRPIQDDVEAFS